MMSHFEVRAFQAGDLPEPPAEEAWFKAPRRSIVASLQGEEALADSLLVSSQRFQVDEGHVFSQPGLSDYFRGFRRVSSGPAVAESSLDGEALHLPVRIFSPASLVTSRGRSVFEGILARSDYLIFEDADLRPADLLAHLEAFSLMSQLSVEDLTSYMGLTGNYAYVVWAAGHPPPNLGGTRIV